MPTIYLKHPVHGTKIANMEAEVEADVANGWVVYNPSKQRATQPVETVTQLAKVAEVAEVAEDEINQLVEVKRRRTV
jgi:hypothetical protein